LRFKLVLVILGVVLVLVYGTLAVLVVGFSGRGLPQSSPPTDSGLTDVPLTAKEAYALALSEARSWQNDAQLVSATASWANVGSEEQLLQDVAWGFTFLSAQSAETQIISVTRLGAERVREMRSSSAVRTADVASWQVDSPEVVSLFLEHGGRDFVNQHPGATISLRLGPEEENARLVWLAIGIHSVDKSTMVLEVDASTGEVLDGTS
jgi:hypothetical protein